MSKLNNLSRQGGFNLIEVMIAFLVLGVGLLGMVGMQTKAMQLNQGAYYRSQANNLAYDMLDRMRANREYIFADGDQYDTELGEDSDSSRLAPALNACDDRGSRCSGELLARYDLAQWKQSIETLLPVGKGEIKLDQQDFAYQVIISISFDGSRGADTSNASAPVVVMGGI